MAKKKSKFVIVNGQLKTRKTATTPKPISPYQKYRNYAIGKYGISSKNVLDYSNYLTAMAESRIATRKGGAWTPESLARAQKYDKTDAQLNAAYRAMKSRDPTLTRKQFEKQESWKELDTLIAARNQELKAQGYLSSQISWIIATEFYGSE